MFQKSNFLAHCFFSSLFILGLVFFAFKNSSPVFAATYKCDTPEEKAACTNLLNQTEKELSDLNKQLDSTKAEGASLKRDKAILDLQIKQSQLKIKAHELTIANLGKDIVNKTKTIATLDNQIASGKESLSQIVRKTREFDSLSLPEFFLGTDNLSKSFADLDSFASVEDSLQEKFNELRETIQKNETEKANLSKKREEVIDTKANAEAEKKKVEKKEAEKTALIALNNKVQSDYQKVIADKAAKAAQIRSALFKLAGAAAIPFEDALRYAKAAEAKTGVSPAFLLAILTQESNLGANVGACYLTDTTTGAGVNVNSGKAWPNLMKPTRDVAPFLEITGNLGYDPLKTKVSCPIAGVGGYGGAMGPSQFIPSTWKLVAPRVATYTGHDAPNPWAADDAFMASAVYLSDLGAVGDSYSAQIRAACKYYGTGGSTCSYGRSVMGYKDKIQGNIDILNGN